MDKKELRARLEQAGDDLLSGLKSRLAAQLFWQLEKILRDTVNEEFEKAFQLASKEIMKSLRDPVGRAYDINGTLMPHGVKYAYGHGRNRLFVIEEPPQMRTVHFSSDLLRWHRRQLDGRMIAGDGLKFHQKTHFRLAFPYVVYILFFSEGFFRSLSVFVANHSIRDKRAGIYSMPLPNVAHDGYVCVSDDRGGKEKSYADGAAKVIEAFWESEFNTDISDNFLLTKERFSHPAFRSLWHWENESLKNPLFVLNVKWERYYGHDEFKTLATAIKYIISVEDWDARSHVSDDVKAALSDVRRSIVNAISRKSFKSFDAVPGIEEYFQSTMRWQLVVALRELLREVLPILAEQGKLPVRIRINRLLEMLNMMLY